MSHLLLNAGGIAAILGCIAWAYVITLIQGVSNNKIWRAVYTSLAISINTILGITEFIIAVKFEELIYSTHWLLIFNTNPSEAKGFISSYIDFKIVLGISGFTILCVLLYQGMRMARNSKYQKKAALFLTIISIISLFSNYHFSLWVETGMGRAMKSIINLREFKRYDLAKTQKPFEVEEKSSYHPKNIILVVGESFDRKHSSLYDYDKTTNPKLTQRKIEGSLIAFPNVESSAPMTNLSMRMMFTLTDVLDDKEWQTHPVLPTFMNKAGYRSMWLSNQTAKSVMDNIEEQLSLLSNERIFTCKDYMTAKSFPDTVLFKPFIRHKEKMKSNPLNFCVIHLMGSHAAYKDRYPDKYAKFKTSDYPAQPQDRRGTFATYDNSIFYNDYVVDKIMELSNSLEAIVIYLPDHGQDFYYTRNIAAHGRISDPVSFKAGCQIPFMIYFTPKFRQNNPELVEKIASFKDAKFETKYLMNTIMELSGYGIKGMETESKSLFKGQLYK